MPRCATCCSRFASRWRPSLTEQLKIDGGSESPEEAALGPVQRAVLAEIREYGRIEPDEAGALAHERRGRHSRAERCGYCGRDGRKILASLSKRGFKNGRRSPAEGAKAEYDPATAEIPF
jgi:hypothetical protein